MTVMSGRYLHLAFLDVYDDCAKVTCKLQDISENRI